MLFWFQFEGLNLADSIIDTRVRLPGPQGKPIWGNK